MNIPKLKKIKKKLIKYNNIKLLIIIIGLKINPY